MPCHAPRSLRMKSAGTAKALDDRRAQGRPAGRTAARRVAWAARGTRLRRRTPAAVLMAGGTVLSRATGFLRTAALATVLGLSVTADAYNAASSVPTMLLVLITGGTLSAALVPILSTPDDPTARRRAAASSLLAVTAVAAVGAVALAVSSPLVADALSAATPPGDRATRTEQTQLFLLLLSPQVLLLGVLVATNGILTVEGRLGRVGATPVLNNVLAIIGIAAYAGMVPSGEPPTVAALWVLGGSSTVALAVAVSSQLVACRALLPSARHLLRSAELHVFRRLLAVGRWSVLYVVSNQLALFVVLVVAGRATGAVSAYQWAFVVMQLPYAILAVPVLSSALPKLTSARNDAARAAEIATAARTLLVLGMLPATFGLLIFGDVAAALLLAGDDAAQVAELAAGIRWFALALAPFTFFQLYTRMCYVLDRNAWPALVNVAVNATLLAAAGAALALPPAAVLDALAVGYGLSYWVGAVLLALLLARHGRDVVALSPGLLRPAVWVAVGATAAAMLRLVLAGPVGVAAALTVLLPVTVAAVWPWRRMRLSAPLDARGISRR